MRSELVATWLLTLALHAGALLLLAWVVDRGAVRAQLAWRELLWRGALFGALLTASAQILLDLPAPARFALPVAPTVPVEAMRPAIVSPMPAAQNATRTRAIAAAHAVPPARITPPIAATATRDADVGARSSWRPSWQAVLVAAWLAGALLTLTRLAIAWLRLEHQLADAQPIARSTLAADAAALAIAARTATPRVAAIDDLGSPIAATGRRIVLPRWALELLGREQLGAMLAHEIAHLARRDPQWKLLTAIWCGLLWFLPVTALARRRLDEIAELRCDHWAASHLGDGRVLAECLAECAGHHFDGIDASLAPAMAHRDSPLLQRIDHLIEGTPVNTNYSPLRAGICALLALVLAAIILPGFGAARAQQAAPPAPATVSSTSPTPSTAPAPVVQATPAVSALPAAAAVPATTPATAPIPDTLPTPPTAPAAPKPPTAPMPARGGGNHLHVSSTTDASGRGHEVTSVQISHNGERYSAKINGKVEFTQREDDIASLEDGGSASFAQKQAGVSRRVDFSSRGGTIERRYFVDGNEQPIDAQARAWIAALIPMVVRETAINAEARVKRIHAAGGTGAVLDEIGRIESGYARGVYLKQLFGVTKLTPAETTRVIGLIDSIDSDYERRNALAALAAANPLDATQQKLVLAQATKIGSDYECAELLVGMLPKLAPGADVRAAWLQAAAGVGSDYEHRRVLSALLEAGNYDDATLAEVIGAAKSIGSDYERRVLLVSAIERIGDADRIAPAYAAAAGDIGSDYERREALVALVRAPKFGPAGARAVLDAASRIGSDFECRELLVELAHVMPGDAGLIARYREVARGLSDFERGQAERALDRFAG